MLSMGRRTWPLSSGQVKQFNLGLLFLIVVVPLFILRLFFSSPRGASPRLLVGHNKLQNAIYNQFLLLGSQDDDGFHSLLRTRLPAPPACLSELAGCPTACLSAQSCRTSFRSFVFLGENVAVIQLCAYVHHSIKQEDNRPEQLLNDDDVAKTQ